MLTALPPPLKTLRMETIRKPFEITRIKITKQARFRRGLAMAVFSFVVLAGDQFVRSLGSCSGGDPHLADKKARIMVIVAFGFSSMIQ